MITKKLNLALAFLVFTSPIAADAPASEFGKLIQQSLKSQTQIDHLKQAWTEVCTMFAQLGSEFAKNMPMNDQEADVIRRFLVQNKELYTAFSATGNTDNVLPRVTQDEVDVIFTPALYTRAINTMTSMCGNQELISHCSNSIAQSGSQIMQFLDAHAPASKTAKADVAKIREELRLFINSAEPNARDLASAFSSWLTSFQRNLQRGEMTMPEFSLPKQWARLQYHAEEALRAAQVGDGFVFNPIVSLLGAMIQGIEKRFPIVMTTDSAYSSEGYGIITHIKKYRWYYGGAAVISSIAGWYAYKAKQRKKVEQDVQNPPDGTPRPELNQPPAYNPEWNPNPPLPFNPAVVPPAVNVHAELPPPPPYEPACAAAPLPQPQPAGPNIPARPAAQPQNSAAQPPQYQPQYQAQPIINIVNQAPMNQAPVNPAPAQPQHNVLHEAAHILRCVSCRMERCRCCRSCHRYPCSCCIHCHSPHIFGICPFPPRPQPQEVHVHHHYVAPRPASKPVYVAPTIIQAPTPVYVAPIQQPKPTAKPTSSFSMPDLSGISLPTLGGSGGGTFSSIGSSLGKVTVQAGKKGFATLPGLVKKK